TPHALHLKNFTYFTFFSELQHSDNLVVETLVITTIFLVSAAANAGAAVLITCERRLLANKAILTLSLFAADLLFVSTIPVMVAVRWTVSWTLGCTARHTLLYAICMSGRIRMEADFPKQILARNFLGHIYISSARFFWVATFTLANSALNPILYSVCQFKSGLRKPCCAADWTLCQCWF
ncbi:LOW QUALITY PROTEIN: free fatty acid receptor 4-like, partial [Leuresthes tenuis]|uniref:LOW QUALITY PROTEIN: free fatty acid receptor 4-like n=1 Tax=Leuresthes tenuis TaxID=355514 RepID=UPI003B514320